MKLNLLLFFTVMALYLQSGKQILAKYLENTEDPGASI